MDDETTGFWALALGAATASGTWEGFRISPLRQTAELHVDGALTVGEEPRSATGDYADYALVLSHPALDRDRVLVAGKGGTVEFGHDVVELLEADGVRETDGPHEANGVNGTSSANGDGESAGALWLTDLRTGATSERCALPRAPRTHKTR